MDKVDFRSPETCALPHMLLFSAVGMAKVFHPEYDSRKETVDRFPSNSPAHAVSPTYDHPASRVVVSNPAPRCPEPEHRSLLPLRPSLLSSRP